MKKSIPILILMVMTAMLVISWKNTIEYKSNIQKEYNTHIAAAQEYEKKKIYIDAAAEYEKALEIKTDDYDTAMKIAEMYYNLDDKVNYIKGCEMAITANNKKLEPYLKIADYYLELNNNQSAFDILSKAQKVIKSDEITSRLLKIKGTYSLSSVDYDILPYHYNESTGIGYATYYKEDENIRGVMSTTGGVIVKGEYEDIGLFADYVVPVKENGEWFYVNNQGYRKLVPDEEADFLGTFGNGYAPIAVKGVYGYVDKNMKEYKMEYSYSGPFCNGVAVVQKDGKWGVINSSLEDITGLKFEEILTDEYGYCSDQGVFWAKQDGKYYLYDLTGKKLSDGYDDAERFASDQPAAVKKDGKWGFVSKDGKMTTEPKYKEARSYSIGYAPFMDDSGKWGCIDQDGNVVIEPFLNDLKSFDRSGKAFCKDQGLSKYLVVNIYDKEQMN